jgi:hypothetical protein
MLQRSGRIVAYPDIFGDDFRIGGDSPLFPPRRSTDDGPDRDGGSAVIHPEHVQEAIRIPPAPDAGASTLPACAPAQVAVRTLIVSLIE